jgi:hypothetical protein
MTNDEIRSNAEIRMTNRHYRTIESSFDIRDSRFIRHSSFDITDLIPFTAPLGSHFMVSLTHPFPGQTPNGGAPGERTIFFGMVDGQTDQPRC